MIKKLSKCSLFQNIELNQIENIMHCMNYNIKQYQANEIIHNTTQNITKIGIILEGSILINKYDFCGNKTIIANINQYQCFGEVYAILKQASNIEIVAKEKCEIIYFDVDKVYNCCHNQCLAHKQLSMNLIKTISKKSLMINEKLEYLSQKRVKDKVLLYLSNQVNKHQSKNFEIEFNRQELADYLGIERSVLSKCLSELKQEGLIDYKKNKFVIICD